MEKVTLFFEERPDIKISMEIYFIAKGKLFFDGYDIGKRVDEALGDSDYEYNYTIDEQEVIKFYPILNLKVGDKSGLLLALKNRFNDNYAYTNFGKFMKEHQIKYDSFSWT